MWYSCEGWSIFWSRVSSEHCCYCNCDFHEELEKHELFVTLKRFFIIIASLCCGLAGTFQKQRINRGNLWSHGCPLPLQQIFPNAFNHIFSNLKCPGSWFHAGGLHFLIAFVVAAVQMMLPWHKHSADISFYQKRSSPWPNFSVRPDSSESYVRPLCVLKKAGLTQGRLGSESDQQKGLFAAQTVRV